METHKRIITVSILKEKREEILNKLNGRIQRKLEKIAHLREKIESCEDEILRLSLEATNLDSYKYMMEDGVETLESAIEKLERENEI